MSQNMLTFYILRQEHVLYILENPHISLSKNMFLKYYKNLVSNFKKKKKGGGLVVRSLY